MPNMLAYAKAVFYEQVSFNPLVLVLAMVLFDQGIAWRLLGIKSFRIGFTCCLFSACLLGLSLDSSLSHNTSYSTPVSQTHHTH
jgi:hypothetical protein